MKWIVRIVEPLFREKEVAGISHGLRPGLDHVNDRCFELSS